MYTRSTAINIKTREAKVHKRRCALWLYIFSTFSAIAYLCTFGATSPEGNGFKCSNVLLALVYLQKSLTPNILNTKYSKTKNISNLYF